MELGERVARIEQRVDDQQGEIIRLRDNASETWEAINRTAIQVEVSLGKIEQITGSIHLIAQNAASVAIERFRTEEAAGQSTLKALLKVTGALVVLVGALVGAPHIPL